jgi:hypothetical protein
MIASRLSGPVRVARKVVHQDGSQVAVLRNPTATLFAFLVRNLRQAAVLLAATFRSDELGQAGPVRRLLAELGRLDGGEPVGAQPVAPR